MTSRAQFRVVFDGPALASHEMDVMDLADSLLALGGLIGAASEIVFEGRAKSTVKVRALQEGSLGIDLAIEQGFLPGIISLLHGDQTPQTLLDHLGISLSAGLPGLVQLLKFLAGREPDSTEQTDRNTTIIKINVNGNHNTIEVNNNVETMRKSPAVRKNLEEFVSPVNKEGIEQVKFYGTDGEGPSITKPETGYFAAPHRGENIVTDSTERASLTIIKPSLESGYKWTLRRGNLMIQASIKDEGYMAKVEKRTEKFSNGDVLDCDLRTIQEEKRGGGFVTTYEVVKVYDHLSSLTSQKLPLKEPE